LNRRHADLQPAARRRRSRTNLIQKVPPFLRVFHVASESFLNALHASPTAPTIFAMPRSAHTRYLTANAHAVGDQYHRTLAAMTRVGELDAKWLDLAFSYRTALEDLQAHLLTLESEPEVELLTEATERYLALIHLDIEAYGTNHSSGAK
jgi:hypothetical protein